MNFTTKILKIIRKILKPLVKFTALILAFSGVTKLLSRQLACPIVARIPRKYAEFDTVIKFRGGLLKINIGESIGKILYFMDAYKPTQLSFFESLLRPGMNFWDLGASLGLFTALAIKHNVRTIAFEPDPALCQYYIRPTVEFNQGSKLAQVVCEAVSDRKGTAKFWLHHLGNLGSGRIYKVEDRDESPTILIQTDTLDGYMERFGRPDLVKMHIEGAEVLAIRGSKKIFQGENAPVLIIEFHTEDIEVITPGTTADVLIGELGGYGYKVLMLTEPKYKESMWHIFYKKDLSQNALKYFNKDTQQKGGYFNK